MSIFLIVKVLDVNYNPHGANLVDVLFPGTGPQAGRNRMKPTGAKGVFELQIPDDLDEIQVGVEEPGFNSVGQTLFIKRGGGLPVLKFGGGGQDLNVRNVTSSSRGGGDFNIELFVVLGQLQDCQDSVDTLTTRFNSKPRIFHTFPIPQPVIDFTGLTVIDPGGKKWDQFIHQPIPLVTPKGKILYAERTTVPKLVGIWVPDGAIVTKERDKVEPGQVPLNFHLFYHPSPGVLSGSYPFDFAFLDLITRYLLYWPFKHKQMINQHVASGSRSILVFPVGDPGQWNGSLGSQTSVLRLLQEVAYFVQRKLRISFPVQPVGRCAVSGFSAGGQYVLQALGGDNAFFHNNVLSEVYGFDIRTDNGTLAANLKSWWRGGADRRAFRFYTTDPGQFDLLKGIDPRAGAFQGAGGAQERQGPQTTVVLLPVGGFWVSLDPENPPVIKDKDHPDDKTKERTLYQKFRPNFDDVHQMFPALFVEHALKHSTL